MSFNESSTDNGWIDIYNFIRFNAPTVIVDYDRVKDFFTEACFGKEDYVATIALFRQVNQMDLNDHRSIKDKIPCFERYRSLSYGKDDVMHYEDESVFYNHYSCFNSLRLAPPIEIFDEQEVPKVYFQFVENFFKIFNLERGYNFCYKYLTDILELNNFFKKDFCIEKYHLQELIPLFQEINRLNKSLRDKAFILIMLMDCYNVNQQSDTTEEFFKHNDCSIENGVVFYHFSSKLRINDTSSQKVILIDPSPVFLKKWMTDSYLTNIGLVLVFQNETLAQFFQEYFKGQAQYGRAISCFSVDSFVQDIDFDEYSNMMLDILVFGNHFQSSEKLSNMLEFIGRNIDSHSMKMMIFDSDLNFEVHKRYNHVFNYDLKVEHISLFPARIKDASVPKLKMLVEYSGCSSQRNLEIERYVLNKSCILKPERAIKLEENEFDFLNRKIRSVYSEQCNLNKRNSSCRSRNDAILFAFSNEIYFYYSKSLDKKRGSIRVTAYAIKPELDKDNSLMLGTRLRIETTVKQHRAKSDDEIMMWLSQEYPFQIVSKKDGNYSIRDEIFKSHYEFYKNKPVTVKTYVYFNRGAIYEHIKSPEHQELLEYIIYQKGMGNIYPEDVTYQSIENMVALSDEVKLVKQKIAIIDMFSTIIDLMVKDKHANYNPLSLSQDIKTTNERELRYAREHLTIKYLANDEIQSILGVLLKGCVSNPLKLGCLIKLLTGVESNVATALQWKDFNKLSDFNSKSDIYQLIIRRQMTNDGVELKKLKRREKFRKIPIPIFLSDILRKVRGKIEKSNPNQNVDEMFILENNIMGDFSHISPKELTAYEIKLVKKLRNNYELGAIFPDDDGKLVTNLLNYMGDIFRTNYRHYAICHAGFETSEVDYLLGLKTDMVFYYNYCDFSNDAAQHILFKKQNRLVSIFSKKSIPNPSIRMIDDNSQVDFYTTDYKDGTTELMMILNGCQGDITMNFKNDNGMDISVEELEE